MNDRSNFKKTRNLCKVRGLKQLKVNIGYEFVAVDLRHANQYAL